MKVSLVLGIYSNQKVGEKLGEKVTDKLGDKLGENETKILDMILKDTGISQQNNFLKI